jgi:hypothetical protein
VAASKRLTRGLSALLSAYEYAKDSGRDRWDFAVEIALLEERGLTTNDFRWLVCKGLAEHRREVTMPGEPGRRFQREGELFFAARTCFALTDAGVCEAERLRHAARDARQAASPGPAPRWDAARRELRLGSQLVKAFRLPSPNQELILTAFDEEGWPPRIDDPLPPQPHILVKRRLHDAIKNLNRNQRTPHIRFLGDGTGQGVCWRLIPVVGQVANLPHDNR